jgi:hypothetical protein
VQKGVEKAVTEMQAGTGGIAVVGLVAILGAAFYASQKAKYQAGAGR